MQTATRRRFCKIPIWCWANRFPWAGNRYSAGKPQELLFFTNFERMKRFFLHVLFWCVYMAQDILLSYLWDTAKLEKLPLSEQALMAMGNSFAYLVPKLLFTYFLLYVILGNILEGRQALWKNIVYILLSLLATLLEAYSSLPRRCALTS